MSSSTNGAVVRSDLRLLAADAAVAKRKFVAGLAADAERERAICTSRRVPLGSITTRRGERGMNVCGLGPWGNTGRAQTRFRDTAHAW